MDRASFNLILGAIIITTFFIGTQRYIYESSINSAISESASRMAEQEIMSFNNQFTSYEGHITGSNLKALIGVLLANSKTYEYEPDRVPTVTVKDQIDKNGNIPDQAIYDEEYNDVDNYRNSVGKIRNGIESKHTYYVEMEYDENEIINEIIIHYNEE